MSTAQAEYLFDVKRDIEKTGQQPHGQKLLHNRTKIRGFDCQILSVFMRCKQFV